MHHRGRSPSPSSSTGRSRAPPWEITQTGKKRRGNIASRLAPNSLQEGCSQVAAARAGRLSPAGARHEDAIPCGGPRDPKNQTLHSRRRNTHIRPRKPPEICALSAAPRIGVASAHSQPADLKDPCYNWVPMCAQYFWRAEREGREGGKNNKTTGKVLTYNLILGGWSPAEGPSPPCLATNSRADQRDDGSCVNLSRIRPSAGDQ